MWFDFSIPKMHFEKTQQFGLVFKEWRIRAKKDWQSGFLE